MANVLFVVGSLTLAAGDTAMRNRMIAAGHTVTNRDDGDADKTTTGFDVVVISSTCASGNVSGYRSVTVGLVNFSHASWDDETDLTTTGTTAISSSTLTELTPQTHAIVIAAGLTAGTLMTAFSTGSTARYIRNNGSYYNTSQASEIARISTTTQDVFGITYEVGATLADGTAAPARRVLMGFLEPAVVNATEEMLDLFDAAVAWAAATPSDIPAVAQAVTTRYVEIDASTSTGDSPLSYSFTQTAGPTVTLSGTGAVRTFVEPDPWDTDIVISVGVTDADLDTNTKVVTIAAPTNGSVVNQYRTYDETTGVWS